MFLIFWKVHIKAGSLKQQIYVYVAFIKRYVELMWLQPLKSSLFGLILIQSKCFDI